MLFLLFCVNKTILQNKTTFESVSERKEKVQRKRLYDVISPSQKKYLEDGGKVWLYFYNKISSVIPKPCFAELMINKR